MTKEDDSLPISGAEIAVGARLLGTARRLLRRLDPVAVVKRRAEEPDPGYLSSVADGRGELPDVTGVRIGDASAFPTAPGVNPMISITALAHRTAGGLLAAG